MDPAVNEQYYLLVAAKLRETAAHVIAMFLYKITFALAFLSFFQYSKGLPFGKTL